MDENDESYYETDIEDLPDNNISEKVSNELNELNEIIEKNIDSPVIINKYTQDINGLIKDFFIIFTIVVLFTNKTVVGYVMNISVLSVYKKTLMFNIILGFIIASVYVSIKKILENFD
jgi:hypothetical protein